MTNLPIDEQLAAQLQRAADLQGCTPEEFALETLASRAREYLEEEPKFTEVQIARMRESMAQLDRGEVVTSEEVNQYFDQLLAKIDAR